MVYYKRGKEPRKTKIKTKNQKLKTESKIISSDFSLFTIDLKSEVKCVVK